MLTFKVRAGLAWGLGAVRNRLSAPTIASEQCTHSSDNQKELTIFGYHEAPQNKEMQASLSCLPVCLSVWLAGVDATNSLNTCYYTHVKTYTFRRLNIAEQDTAPFPHDTENAGLDSGISPLIITALWNWSGTGHLDKVLSFGIESFNK